MEAEIITVTCPPWSHSGGGKADIRSLASSDISTIILFIFLSLNVVYFFFYLKLLFHNVSLL